MNKANDSVTRQERIYAAQKMNLGRSSGFHRPLSIFVPLTALALTAAFIALAVLAQAPWLLLVAGFCELGAISTTISVRGDYELLNAPLTAPVN